MNYLGHSFLSFGDADILCGNMMGDFVKGSKAILTFPEGLQAGLMRHRYIDTFTDEHEAIREAKTLFRADYGLYSGAVADTLMDYFLANDERFFTNEEALWNYSMEVYTLLASKSGYFLPAFVPYYESMVKHNWLFHYRSDEGIKRSLTGLMRRAKHIREIETAFQIFKHKQTQLNELYQSFINDIIAFVKIEFEGK